MGKVRVTEMFYSIQGEGISQGCPSVFVRLWGCNLNCVWCDSKTSWETGKEKAHLYEKPTDMFEDVLSLIPSSVKNHRNIDIVFTGGEPLIHVDDEFIQLVEVCSQAFKNVYFETNGTISPKVLKHVLGDCKFNCSPKTDNSNVSINKAFKPRFLKEISKIDGSCFKFVIKSKGCIDDALFYIRQVGIPGHMVYLMPEGQTREEIQKRLELCALYAIKYGFNVSNRMQVQIWNRTMGV